MLHTLLNSMWSLELPTFSFLRWSKVVYEMCFIISDKNDDNSLLSLRKGKQQHFSRLEVGENQADSNSPSSCQVRVNEKKTAPKIIFKAFHDLIRFVFQESIFSFQINQRNATKLEILNFLKRPSFRFPYKCSIFLLQWNLVSHTLFGLYSLFAEFVDPVGENDPILSGNKILLLNSTQITLA